MASCCKLCNFADVLKEEQDFIKYWEENRVKQKRFFKQLRWVAIRGTVCSRHVPQFYLRMG